MARKNTKSNKRTSKKLTSEVTKSSAKTKESEQSLFEKLQTDIQENNSLLNLILGGLIVVVLGILIFNYFNKPEEDLGPSQTTTETSETEDVAKENLPGNYNIKEGDTLFLIAEKYYDDGNKFNEIVTENNLADENQITAGQKITIPKLEEVIAQATPTPSPSETTTSSPSPSAEPETATGGAENQTIWGEKINGETYTVQFDDWLSKIAGRAYGDPMAYDRIAKANNIPDPNVIEIGVVLKIPR